MSGEGVTKADGIWTQTIFGEDNGPLPSAITGRTIAICRNHDPVCAPGINAVKSYTPAVGDVRYHVDTYYETHSDVLGVWVADKITGRPFTLPAE